MNRCAPIALFVYNRPAHTKRTIEALQRNVGARESELVVFCDGLREGGDQAQVAAVRELVASVSGFKSVTVIERENNFGLSQSFIQGINWMMEQYERIIVVEDDNLTSPYFLQFMNDALNMYDKDLDVASICGYSYPTKNQLPETYFLSGVDTWGVALWRRGWGVFEEDASKLLHELQMKGLGYEFDWRGQRPLISMLEAQARAEIDSWTIRWLASAFLAGMFTLYPGKSFVQNIGNDGTGTHAKDSGTYNVQLANAPLDVGRMPVEQNEEAYRELQRFFQDLRPTLGQKIRHKVNKLIG